MAIILTNKPKRGDAVLGVLATKQIVYATNESMLNSTLDESKYEYIGPVLKRRGKKVLIAYHTQSDQQWSERYSFKLTGYTLDGTARTGVLQIWTQGTVAKDTNYTISYNASTVDEMVAQLNAAFADSTNYPYLASQDWTAKKESDDSITLHFAFADWRQSGNAGASGFTLTGNLLPGVKALANIRRRNGAVGGEGVISSWYRALAYFRNDQPSGNYNPATDVTSIKCSYPICLPAYLGTSANNDDHCAYLRGIFGEGEQGWLKFMESCLPALPSDWGNMGMKDGKVRTQYLAQQTYTSRLKTSATPLCPAAKYCVDAATQVMPAGSFWLPTTEEVYDLLDGIQYNTVNNRNADPVNALQYKMNKSAVSNGSYVWSCLRTGAYVAWYANGSNGFFSNGNMYGRIRVIPVSLLTLA